MATQLVRVRYLELTAQLHLARVGLQFSQQDLYQRGLARAVGADNADTVATADQHGKIADHFLAVEAVADVL